MGVGAIVDAEKYEATFAYVIPDDLLSFNSDWYCEAVMETAGTLTSPNFELIQLSKLIWPSMLWKPPYFTKANVYCVSVTDNDIWLTIIQLSHHLQATWQQRKVLLLLYPAPVATLAGWRPQ